MSQAMDAWWSARSLPPSLPHYAFHLLSVCVYGISGTTSPLLARPLYVGRGGAFTFTLHYISVTLHYMKLNWFD